ncbi:MAG: YkgJ family cysteine cluster protein [Oligoflexia bacterium]|nr:YkgJ family cysteine cluster protein [Oligoflexia bacterium]
MKRKDIKRAGRISAINKFDVNDFKTWTCYQKKLCTNCLAGCCSLALEVSAADLYLLQPITDRFFEEDDFYRKEIILKLKKVGIIEKYNFKANLFTLARKASGECVYLNLQKRCSVYDRRPRTCQAFPLIPYFQGHCPYQRKTGGD